jgi:hypothetical protein
MLQSEHLLNTVHQWKFRMYQGAQSRASTMEERLERSPAARMKGKEIELYEAMCGMHAPGSKLALL